jgi:hypothetical protein
MAKLGDHVYCYYSMVKTTSSMQLLACMEHLKITSLLYIDNTNTGNPSLFGHKPMGYSHFLSLVSLLHHRPQ